MAWGQQFAVRIMRMRLCSEERTYAVGAKLSKRHSNLASAHHVSWRRLSEKGRCEIWAFLQARSPPILAERVRTGWANMIPKVRIIIMNEGTLLIIIIRRYSLYEGTYYIYVRSKVYIPSYLRMYVRTYLYIYYYLLFYFIRTNEGMIIFTYYAIVIYKLSASLLNDPRLFMTQKWRRGRLVRDEVLDDLIDAASMKKCT